MPSRERGRGRSAMTEVRFTPIEARPESLADMVYDAIRRLVMDKTLPPGSRVSENALAERLGVSKTPVREAMLRLRQIGVIQSDGVRGGRVARSPLPQSRPETQKLGGAQDH